MPCQLKPVSTKARANPNPARRVFRLRGTVDAKALKQREKKAPSSICPSPHFLKEVFRPCSFGNILWPKSPCQEGSH